ncbi:MAG: hypothetical protein WA303_23420 [Bradyrhizobium sp.]|jgi:hypothetical protein
MYPWPLGEFDFVMEVAPQIAMDYLERTEPISDPDLPTTDPMRVILFREAQSTAATAIAGAWKAGVRYRLKLANIAINAVERERQPLIKFQGC